jgi:hypothetical protein
MIVETIETTADQPGKTVYCGPTEGGAFVSLYIALSADLFGEDGRLDLRGEHALLTPDEARRLAKALEDAALDVDVACT